jgi:Uma2 family endonuclease
MSSAATRTLYAAQEYLAFERKSPIKHEYRNGSIFEMPRSNRWHKLITGNLGCELSTQVRDRPCELYMSAMRILVSRTGLYTYPDVVAVCGEPRFEDSERDTLLNPNVIIEVLSESTEAYDRGKKFGHYRRLESLREYVLVAQDEVRVERYTRQGDDWLLTELSNLDDTLRLESIGCAVALHEIYAKVELANGGYPLEAERH